MKKRPRDHSENGEPLSEGRVEYLEQARARATRRRVRRTAIILTILIAVVLVATGIAGTSVALLKDGVDTLGIAAIPGTGWPQQTGIQQPLQVETLTGSFVALGDESCVVYSNSGRRLNAIQSGYARPAIAAGKTRFVLYNRSGTELRVESRTQNLYTKTMENGIYLCAMSDSGTLAVVTEDTTSMAKLWVYSPTMTERLNWAMSAAEGTPLRMAFSPDERRLAVAAVTASGGQMITNLYVIPLAQGEPINVGSQSAVPQWLGWLSQTSLLAVYDTKAVVYNVTGGEHASYEFNGQSLQSVSVDGSGNTALLLASGQVYQVVAFNKNFDVQCTVTVPAASSVVRAGERFYLLTETTVGCYAASGQSSGSVQWSEDYAVRPQHLIVGTKRLLVFSGNTVEQLEPPQQTDSGS